jgi:hypothetical protein
VAPFLTRSRRSRLQRSSHAALMQEVRASPRAGVRPSRFDAIVVPASRGVAALDAAANLSIRLGTPLIVLCSRDTRAADAAEHLARIPDCRALIIDVPLAYQHDVIPTRTSVELFRAANAGRNSDLSLKRNLGLLMARYHGWGKILFLDDDIGDSRSGEPVSIPVEIVHQLSQQLDSHQVAGLACRDYPDNSVVCHARRLAGLRQDTFITGAALAVNCNDQPLPFFPDLYNEDWFFFSRMAARRDIAHVGYATQAPYDPFANPRRAREEEFGDLLAEGLYALFEDQSGEVDYFRRLDAADTRYWERFIAARESDLHTVRRRLSRVHDRRRPDARLVSRTIESLDAAADQLSDLTAAVCAGFLDAWSADLTSWERAEQQIAAVGSTRAALIELGLDEWTFVRPGPNNREPVVRPASWSSGARSPGSRSNAASPTAACIRAL